MKKSFVLIIGMFCAVLVWSQGLKTQGTIIVDQNGSEVMLRGMGLGGWMLMEGYMMKSSDVADTQHEFRSRLVDLMGEEKTDEFFNTWLANHVTEADVDSLANWGYNSVRVPLHYNLFTLPIEDEPVPGENTWLEKGFDMVDSLLQWCESNNIYLILDLHAAPGGQGANAAICDYDPTKPSLWESEENRDKTVALWAKLADRYKDEEWIGGYDLLNEVNWNLPGNVMLRDLYEEITAVIREVDTNHIIFIEGNWFANDFTGLTPPWDDNMAYSFHKYWNFNDQGSVDWVLELPEQYNVPLWMGEGGENSNVWFHDAIELLEDNDIGWSFWPVKRVETIVGQYSILFTDGYKAVLDYWRGEGPEPTVDEAYDAMMELAINSNSLNCLYRKDVWDAQIRQVSSDETIPYSNHTIPGVVFMPDFDLGKLYHAYYDVDNVSYSMSTGEFTAWNSGWHYRNDGVDIEPNNDPVNSNGFHVGFVQKGEWINYTVNIDETAAYTAKARVASEASGGKFHLSIDGQDVTASSAVSATGGWTNFEFMNIENVLLEEGEHVLTFHVDNGTAFNISSIEFIKTGSVEQQDFLALNGHTCPDEKSLKVAVNQPILPESLDASIDYFSVVVNGEVRSITEVTMEEENDKTLVLIMEDPKVYTDNITVSYNGTIITSISEKTLGSFSDLHVINTLPQRFILPGRIQAEDYHYMEGLGTEETTDVGGGKNIGWTEPGDFADYLIFAHDEGFYQMNLRLAAPGSQAELGFYLVDESLEETELFTLPVPNTGGWQNWTTASVNLAVPGGNHTLRMRVLGGGFNMNWFEFELLDGEDEVRMNLTPAPLVYPVPLLNNQLFINVGETGQSSLPVSFFNLAGELVFSKEYTIDRGVVEVDASTISQGVFIMSIITREGSFNYKIIKQ